MMKRYMPSFRSNDDEGVRRIGIESRRRTRRNAGYLSAGLIALMIILGVTRSSEFILLALLYVSIVFAGISLPVFILLSEGSSSDQERTNWDTLFSGAPTSFSESEVTKGGRNPVDSLYVYVKYASRGSFFSRRLVAFELKSAFQNSPLIDETGNLISGVNERSELGPDLNRVYFPFLPESKEYQQNELRSPTWKASRRERDAYLASLQRIVSKINGYPMSPGRDQK